MSSRSGARCLVGLRAYRAPAVLMLVVHVAGCTTWTPVTPSPRAVSEEAPRRVRATTLDGATVVLENPVIRGDSIVEVLRTCELRSSRSGRSACREAEGARLSMTDITALEVARSDVGKFVVGLMLTSAAVGLVVVGATYLMLRNST